ncbi:hypothetical protein AR457_13815 [Streptomyces agglomeratus]|uniref:Uncharacterized protein n=1 Tax=Streptomyces agglomeratus TaxID=285458 RepID=A0A1E5P750_9ACTN|nr:hypothetical protein [Streptomyces agglomeratus]OEJ25376.1 hypothetical protein AS594_13640 [Streptomyces agglomeratus]OEJ40586.1 hypothetical protein BGK70_22835 [Streptomyces agglomeratus]OEJ45033.1 hypothetical protein AR457_13815 [Streptomyces agglomeratus]OEJ53136.1 hypothetical protein BGK72_22465 [Streptomyces agglomeratus]OEJ60471.1 hypothetical protein BGM19_23170 [Streptomyces agglomeratus]
MGFWGYFVVGRSARPLSELASLAEVREGLSLHETRGDGWQVWARPSEPQVGDMGALARGVCGETGTPAIFAFVMDSACVVVEAATSAEAAGSWFGCLGREAMAGHLGADGLVLEDLFLPPERAAAKAVEWAAATGRTVAPGALLDVLREEADPVAEELFARFLDRLGL